MGKINVGRVLLGGLVTGLILNIGEYLLNDKVLAKEMAELFRRCGFPKPGTNFIVIAVVITFVLGIVIVFGYAAIRPRFGPGPKTAIIAGLLAWFAVVVYQNVIVLGLGMETTNVFAIVIGWELVEYLLATMLGAWLYNEA
ncbi:MAG TPA: hypothetical protein VK475_11170 [Pyrinomonadaceae bacterium]|nr:hypothetical protein [Pyrinomonadaceae bacterium]